MTLFVVAIVAYLLGSIPFGYILVRLFRGEDIRKSGSGNIGATNVARSSRGLGLITLLLDAGKGAAAVYFARWAMVHVERVLIAGSAANDVYPVVATFLGTVAALFAILGHLFPVWLKFRGGKGVATALGSFIVVAPKGILCVIVIFAILFLLFRYVSFSSVMAVACFPLAAWFFREYGEQPLVLAMMSLASFLIIWKHRKNLERLMNGTEPKFGGRG